MRSRIAALRTLALLLAIVANTLTGRPVDAQVRIPADALVDVAELDRILRVGDQLERERRWGEALTHYEEATHQHPGRNELQDRLVSARLHYDVVRRYSDTSFVNVATNFSQRQALDLYMEVLLKIHSHYVEHPEWNKLVQRGITALQVASSESSFAERFGLTATEAEMAAFMDGVRARYLPAVKSRLDARDAVFHLAHQVEQRFRLPVQATVLECACAAAGSLDEYSAFLSGNQMDEVLSQIEGNFVGLGIELKADNQTLLIVSVIPGGPAADAGVQAGDRIIRVDSHSTEEVSTDVAADMLKGPEGSAVSLLLVDGNQSQRNVQLIRRRVEVPSVEDVSMIDLSYGVGYLRLTSFQKTTNRDVDSALWKLHHQGMRSVIIDVRGNPGGLLTAAVEVADKFVSEGSIVSTRGRSPRENYEYRAHLVGTWRVPLIVLIDGNSASASEIFAGAVRDNHSGTVVGTRTYGKGSVQGIFPLKVANAGIRLTTAKFFSPHGHPISRRGVQPDVIVHTTARTPSSGEMKEDDADAILEAGVQVARKQLSRR